MPKIFEYLGFVFFFYSNDHDPVHCHVKKGEKEAIVTIEFAGENLTRLSIRKYRNSGKTLTPAERKSIKEFAEIYAMKIRLKWLDFRAERVVIFEKVNKLTSDRK